MPRPLKIVFFEELHQTLIHLSTYVFKMF
jgi:hypothetical protein